MRWTASASSGDGRLLGLNSYENRVYLAYCEDAPPVVVKFYRPARWSDAQILEEHAFVAELVEREIPAVAPLVLRAATLHRFADLRFAVYPKHGGRTPELDDPDTLEWLGRFIGRIHAVGRLASFAHRPALDIATFGDEPRAFLLANDFVPPDLLDAYRTVSAMALAGVRHCFERAGDRVDAAAARRLPREQRAVERRWPAFRRLRRRAHGTRPCRTCGCCCPAIAPR